LTRPFPYQIKTVRKLERFKGRGLLALEMGLGKSLCALLYLMRNPDALPAVVVCPASVKWTWEREAAKHAGWRAIVLEGTKPPSRGHWIKHKLVVLNYDILTPWLEYLDNLNPRTVILDECQALMTPTTKRTKAARKLCDGVPHVIALSGTPLVNRPMELWTTLNILRPEDFPSRWQFGHRYCGAKLTYWGWSFQGASRLDELQQKLIESSMIRYRKADVLDQLPAKRRSVVPLTLPDRKEYDHALKDFLGWLKGHNPGKADSASKAEQVVKLGYLKRLAAELKTKLIFGWLDDFLTASDEKIIVFGIHRKILGSLRERYKGQSVLIDGSVTGKKRRDYIDQFLRYERTRILFGNIRAAGVGWSAKGVSNVAFVELDWTPGAHVQAEDRCHGIGRGKEGVRSVIHYLVARDTVETNLVKLIQSKQKVLSKVLDGKKTPEDLDIFDQLCKELQQ